MTELPVEEQLPESDFIRFRQLIESETGIHLSDAKRGLLVARLSRRVRALGMASLREYFNHVHGADPDERVRMFDAISTNETRFFREPHQFEFMSGRIFPQWKALAARGARERRVRIWSAGCSSGEEPYSIAMALLEAFDPDEWDLRIDATDLSTRVLDIARRGEWPARKAADIPEPLLRRYMLRGTRSQEGVMKAGEAVRDIVRFGRLNLMAEPYPMPGEYDLILCRNVLIYLGHANRVRVVQNLLSHLAGGGFFFVGHAETLSGIASGPRPVSPNVYVQ
ncbi:MAG TPA: protein-glutamate O-methyltransferase CheR [Thermoanaerobaculia bacterium]|nr:protein-glutamate O-methyltransferase CheR [Thermoanaerobaculia bacterium]